MKKVRHTAIRGMLQLVRFGGQAEIRESVQHKSAFGSKNIGPKRSQTPIAVRA